MITSLASMYRVAAIRNFNEELLIKRENSISTLINTKNISWLLDCIRLFLNKPLSNSLFVNEFDIAFQKEDPLFDHSPNNLEKLVLAGAVVSSYIKKEVEAKEGQILVALALVSGTFFVPSSDQINFQVIQEASDFLNREGKSKRNVQTQARSTVKVEFPNYPSIGGDVNKLDIYTKAFSDALREDLKQIELKTLTLERRISILEEESDIHWWLFRTHSSRANLHLNQIESTISPFIIAWELVQLTKILPAPPNILAFIQKAISALASGSDSNYSISDIIASLYKAQVFSEAELNENSFLDFGNLTPLLFAFQKIVESGGDLGWTAVFKRATLISTDSTSTIANFTHQIYLELLLAKMGLTK